MIRAYRCTLSLLWLNTPAVSCCCWGCRSPLETQQTNRPRRYRVHPLLWPHYTGGASNCCRIEAFPVCYSLMAVRKHSNKYLLYYHTQEQSVRMMLRLLIVCYSIIQISGLREKDTTRKGNYQKHTQFACALEHVCVCMFHNPWPIRLLCWAATRCWTKRFHAVRGTRGTTLAGNRSSHGQLCLAWDVCIIFWTAQRWNCFTVGHFIRYTLNDGRWVQHKLTGSGLLLLLFPAASATQAGLNSTPTLINASKVCHKYTCIMLNEKQSVRTLNYSLLHDGYLLLSRLVK